METQRKGRWKMEENSISKLSRGTCRKTGSAGTFLLERQGQKGEKEMSIPYTILSPVLSGDGSSELVAN